VFIIGVSALLIIPVSRLKSAEEISQFLPKTKAIDKINEAMQSMKIRDKLAINIHLSDSNSVNEILLTEMADLFVDSIQQHFDTGFISELKYKQSEEDFQNIYQFYHDHIPLFLNENDYQRLSGLLKTDSLQQLIKGHFENLISPTGIISGKFIQSDPLNLTTGAMKSLQGLQLDQNMEIYEGYFFSKNHKNLLVFLTPGFRSAENDKSETLINYLSKLRADINKASGQKVEMEYYGGPAVAVDNAKCIKRDTNRIAIISLALISIFLIYYFRNIRSLLVLLLPVFFGGLFSLAMISIFKGSISVIAIGAGSVVFGIAINYSLHILTHYKHYGNVEIVIKDLTKPMLLGCITTVSAFFSLMFLKSEALNDFGLFAGLSLVGTLLFSFIIMPHLFKKETEVKNHHTFFDKISNVQFHKNKWLVALLVISVIFLSLFAGKVEFEKDMRHLSYESPELEKWHHNLDRINHYTQQSVFVSVTSSSVDQAIIKNKKIHTEITDLSTEHPTLQYSGLGGILIPQEEQLRRIKLWNEFWTEGRKTFVKQEFQRIGSSFGFNQDAFNPFYENLNIKPSPFSTTEFAQFTQLVGSGYLNYENGTTTIYSIVKAPENAKQKIYNQWTTDNSVTVFDNARITGLFAEALANDFQLILVLTALLVFGFMLFSHGRIETTLINFLPMFISWLCILGIMGLFGIKFNLINIIISTFIFGLGDDYSIFILDGLTAEYKYGKKVIGSYRSSILMSAAITLIGIGALIFADHPALKSIALIAVLGIIVVILVSFIIQPLIYNWLILSRTKRGLPPYTAINLLITLMGFAIFALGSILLSLFGLILFYLTPFKKDTKKLWFHYALMVLNKTILACFVNVKKTIIKSDDTDFTKPSIIIANHQSHIDLALIMQLHPKIIFFTNDWVWNFPFYKIIVRLADFYPASRGYENSIDFLKPLVNKGYSIMIFPEGTRSLDGSIGRFHKGAAFLQHALGLDLLPIFIHGAGDCVSKGDFHFKNGQLTLKILPRIPLNVPQTDLSYKDKTKWVCEHMRNEYNLLKNELENGDYYRSKLISNFIYKGPVLEWYTRIKTRMEKNYTYFDSLLPKKGIITDAGCGNGYLSYTLSFTSPARKIIAFDYDEDKISIANSCFSQKKSDIQFLHRDINSYTLENSDGIIALDVLHYLDPESQVKVIHKFLDKLNKNGVLILRDANSDMKGKHLGTRYTEFFSTNMGYNKISEKGLSFVSSKLIEDTILERGGFSCEIIDNTRYLSNLVYIIKHKD
jgi:1-acyl-sn-glycerol-3-phosphate acyltransferase